MCLAIPGRILSVSDEPELLRTARVDFGGVVKQVALACTPEARVGEYVLVHVGVAIGVIDEAEAQRVFEYLAEAGELREIGGAGS